MKTINKKILSFLVLLGIMTSSSYAMDLNSQTLQTDNLSTYVGSGAIDNMILDYEKDLKSLKDNKKLDKLYNEKKNIKSRQISNDVKDDILNDSFSKIKRKKIKDNLPKDFINDANVVTNTIVSSIKKQKKESYRFLVKTSLSLDELKSTIEFFDKAEINYLNDIDDKKMYEVLLPYSGKISKIIGNGLESGEIPENLLPNVEIIQPFAVKMTADSAYLSGENLSNIWGITKIGAQNYQKGLSTKPKIKVGIIDTGIDYNNVELSKNVYKNTQEIAGNSVDDDKNGYVDDVYGYNFVANNGNSLDDHGHGTHVSGITGAGVNGKGIFGVNSNVSLVPLKVLDKSGYGSSYGIVDAINYAANNGIKVINLSLGGNGNPTNDIMCNAITNAKAKGVITIVAAGNENADVVAKVPAGCKDAITVGAVDSALKKASFSNYGTEVDVAAPGVGIYSTVLNNSYATWDGTSMATPFVSGLVSSILANNPNLTYDNIKQILINNSDGVTSSVNIGKFINMTKIMTYLGVNDDNYVSPGTGSGTTTPPTGTGGTSTGVVNPPTTGSGTTGSGTTGTGNILPKLTLTTTKISLNKYTILANATDSDGKIVKYEILKDNVLVSSGSSYTTDITKDTTILVRVTDDKGGQVSASTLLKYEIPVVVNTPPTVNITTGIYNKYNNYVSIDSSDKDGKIAKEQIYINGKLTYSYSFNANTTKIMLYYSKGYSFTLRVVVTDDKGGITDKSLTIK